MLQCFGNMTVSLLVGDIEEGEGTAKCRPVFEDPDNGIPIAPQGFIADGEDGSHWVCTLLIYLNVYRFPVISFIVNLLSIFSSIFIFLRLWLMTMELLIVSDTYTTEQETMGLAIVITFLDSRKIRVGDLSRQNSSRNIKRCFRFVDFLHAQVT